MRRCLRIQDRGCAAPCFSPAETMWSMKITEPFCGGRVLRRTHAAQHAEFPALPPAPLLTLCQHFAGRTHCASHRSGVPATSAHGAHCGRHFTACRARTACRAQCAADQPKRRRRHGGHVRVASATDDCAPEPGNPPSPPHSAALCIDMHAYQESVIFSTCHSYMHCAGTHSHLALRHARTCLLK